MATFLCKKCGVTDDASRWAGNTLVPGFCHACSFWLRIIIDRNDPRRVFANGCAYFVADAFNTTGGMRMTFARLSDGLLIQSPNTWHNGAIPKHFRRVLPDTHKIVTQ